MSNYPDHKLADTGKIKRQVQADVESWLKDNKPTIIETGVSGNVRTLGFNNRSNEVNKRRSAQAKRRKHGRL